MNMTVKQLRELLINCSSKYDDVEFNVWLPATYIALEGQPFYYDKCMMVLIEGHVVKDRGRE